MQGDCRAGTRTVMAVAMGRTGDQHDPAILGSAVLAIAGISLRRVMGFTMMSFLVGVVVFGVAC